MITKIKVATGVVETTNQAQVSSDLFPGVTPAVVRDNYSSTSLPVLDREQPAALMNDLKTRMSRMAPTAEQGTGSSGGSGGGDGGDPSTIFYVGAAILGGLGVLVQILQTAHEVIDDGMRVASVLLIVAGAISGLIGYAKSTPDDPDE